VKEFVLKRNKNRISK